MQFCCLPASELTFKATDNQGSPDRPRHSSWVTSESLYPIITVRVNPITGERTEEEGPQSPTFIEKCKLKRVANSFCVRVPASEFVMNPVRSLFSSFIASENESCSNTNNVSSTANDPFVSGWQDLSVDNLNLTMINDDDDIPIQNGSQITKF
jgi:hypothetical protein